MKQYYSLIYPVRAEIQTKINNRGTRKSHRVTTIVGIRGSYEYLLRRRFTSIITNRRYRYVQYIAHKLRSLVGKPLLYAAYAGHFKRRSKTLRVWFVIAWIKSRKYQPSRDSRARLYRLVTYVCESRDSPYLEVHYKNFIQFWDLPGDHQLVPSVSKQWRIVLDMYASLFYFDQQNWKNFSPQKIEQMMTMEYLEYLAR